VTKAAIHRPAVRIVEEWATLSLKDVEAKPAAV